MKQRGLIIGLSAIVLGVLLLFAARTWRGVNSTARVPSQKAKPSGQWKESDLPIYRDLRELPKLGFLKPGDVLIVGTRRDIMPEFESLFLWQRGHYRQITYPADLEGFVSIQSNEDALQYVRLFSSLAIPTDTRDFYGKEVLHLSELSPELFFGSNAFKDLTPEFLTRNDQPNEPHQRLYGIMLDEEWRENGLSEPSVRQEGQNFVVTSWFWKGSGSDTLYLVGQTVTPEGKIAGKIIKKKKASGIVYFAPIRI